jgi:hypothetical protein
VHEVKIASNVKLNKMSESRRIDNEIDFVSVPLATGLNFWCNLQNTGFKVLPPQFQKNPNRAEKYCM